jgi:hypothetical protein
VKVSSATQSLTFFQLAPDPDGHLLVASQNGAVESLKEFAALPAFDSPKHIGINAGTLSELLDRELRPLARESQDRSECVGLLKAHAATDTRSRQ